MFVAWQISDQAQRAREQAKREGRDPEAAAQDVWEAGSKELRHCMGVIAKGAVTGLIRGDGSVARTLQSVGSAVCRDLKKV